MPEKKVKVKVKESVLWTILNAGNVSKNPIKKRARKVVGLVKVMPVNTFERGSAVTKISVTDCEGYTEPFITVTALYTLAPAHH